MTTRCPSCGGQTQIGPALPVATRTCPDCAELVRESIGGTRLVAGGVCLLAIAVGAVLVAYGCHAVPAVGHEMSDPPLEFHCNRECDGGLEKRGCALGASNAGPLVCLPDARPVRQFDFTRPRSHIDRPIVGPMPSRSNSLREVGSRFFLNP